MPQDKLSYPPALAGLVAILAVTLLASAAWAAALKQAVLIPQWEPQAQFAGYYVALAKGFYTAAGVDMPGFLTVVNGLCAATGRRPFTPVPRKGYWMVRESDSAP